MDNLDILSTVKPLAGTSNFESWKRAISTILEAEKLWGHVEGEENRLNPKHHLAIRREPPAITSSSTVEQIDAYNSWALADARAILIITLRIAPVPGSRLPRGTNKTARVIWKAIHSLFGPPHTIHNAFGRPNILSAIKLRTSLYKLKMKDHHDYMKYLSKFSKARAQFASLDIPFSELEMVQCIIDGLPRHGSWEVFHMIVFHMMQEHIKGEAVATVPAPPDTLLNRITAAISTESLRLQSAEPLHLH